MTRTADPAADFAAAMSHCLAQGAPWPGAVAVSGGGDSLALMCLIGAWGRTRAEAPVVLTVDHGLAPHSAKIAAHVVGEAERLGLRAHALVWKGKKPNTDVEAAARTARYTLMGAWCAHHAIKGLYVAHTLEDQAETFLLRLARGSGLDGLAAMRPVAGFPLAEYAHLRVVRPLLNFRRADLRAMLAQHDMRWAEDPMNDDPRFARTRLRRAAPLLDELGLSAERIATAASHLSRAREALEATTAEFLDQSCRFLADGRIVLDGKGLALAPPEIGLRALAHVLARVSGQAYRPRFERLERLYRGVCEDSLGAGRTLHGCRIRRAPKACAVFGADSYILSLEPPRKATQKPTVAPAEQIS